MHRSILDRRGTPVAPRWIYPEKGFPKNSSPCPIEGANVIYSSSKFSRFAKWTSHATGHPVTFIGAASIVIIWCVTGPIFHYSDTWQLAINTGTTIVTFLMVFLIQNTQNRDSHAVHLKLDELIRAVSGAHNALLDLEGLEETDLERFRARYQEIARSAREALGRGEMDTGTPEVGLDAEP
jgi:low affinity Fe/Cu permease